MDRLRLEVAGMTCGHCKMKVEQALRSVPGTVSADVFLEDGGAEVLFDGARASAREFVDAVRRAGYQASVQE